jgi:hypothetical protein
LQEIDISLEMVIEIFKKRELTNQKTNKWNRKLEAYEEKRL